MKIIVHRPTDDAGMQELREKAAEFHAEGIIEQIKAMNLPRDQKKKLLEMVIARIEKNNTS